MNRKWVFLFNVVFGLSFGILRSSSAVDPFLYQPRIEVEDGHLTIHSAIDRNISIKTNGQGRVQINNADMARILSGRSTTPSSSLLSINRRLNQLVQNYQSVSALTGKVRRLEDNVTEINEKLNDFMGSDQNRITNRGMRRYFGKVRALEDKVDRLTQLLTENECSSNPCRNGGTCNDAYNGYACTCPSNWEGPTCEMDVNECSRHAGTGFGCQNGATCTNLQGSYRCDCPVNWYGVHCTEKHDDCSSASHSELCGHGTCVNEQRVVPGQPKYRCICDAGWTKPRGGRACTEDIDECDSLTPICSTNPRVLCINLPGTFYCGSCPAGYTGNGLYCDDINECEFQNGGCSTSPFVECHNTLGSRRCGPCPAGFMGNGEHCTYLSACNNNRGGCHPLATCIDNPAITGSYRECRCPPGYQGSGEGLSGCSPISGQGVTCSNNPCVHGTCQMVGVSYHCTCSTGYSGRNCDQEYDHCLSMPCLNGGQCLSIRGSFSCICRQGFSGTTCENSQGGCGGRFDQENGTLTYQTVDNQQGAAFCEWFITVPENKVINLTFDHVDFGSSSNCESTYLQLFDGPNSQFRSLGRFCYYYLVGGTMTSTHNRFYLLFRSGEDRTSITLTITWTAVDPACGGVLNETNYGAIESPGYPGLYPINRNCSWLVKVAMGKRIQFTFATLMLEHHENCSYDYLKVYDGATEADPEIGTFCSTETPPPLITSGHLATLVFHSDISVSDHGFHIAYSAVPGIPGCGNIYTSPEGSISSPNFPNVYQDNLMCEWIIRIHPDNRIKITFTDFHLESHSSCNFDFLEIYNGESDADSLLARYCGSNVPQPLLSVSNKLYLRFKTDVSQRYSGFKLDYRTICGRITTELQDTLTSPYYPDPYPNNAICLYEVLLPPRYIVNMTIKEFSVESHSDCRYDHLEIRDGDNENSTLLSKFCGEMYNRSVVSSYNKLWMKFQTDGSLQFRGFEATYSAIDMGCGGLLTEPGTIDSPLDMNAYPHSVNCTWLLRAPEGHIIKLSFTTFVLEQGPNCPYDYVVVKESDGELIGRYCGRSTPPTITSLDNTLLVTFVTDRDVAYDGFSASFVFLNSEQVCGGDFYHESGTIQSPGYPRHYPNSIRCVWVLHAGNNKQIVLNVTDFALEYHSSCIYDYLEIRNGGYEFSPLVGKYCGEEIIRIVRSHGNALLLKFVTDSSQFSSGFQIKFDSTSDGCGGELNSPQGSIISPNYPQPYPENADCQWLIRISQGSALSIVITDIDIEEHATCDNDYLQIFDGNSERSKSLVRICNNQQNPGPILTKTNSALVRFRSDFSFAAGGFRLSYHTVCNNVLTGRRGVIESPNFPNSYPHNFNCSWTIRAPRGNNISLSFSHLFIEDDALCNYDYVEIQELRSDGPLVMGKYCGSHRPYDPIVIANTAIVRLITDRTNSGQGFRIEWTVEGCGWDIINKPYGEISSPNYPHGYPVATECFWRIWYPPGKRVRFLITDLDVEFGPDCVYDFIKVYGGEDESSPLLLETCHITNNFKEITSHGNEIYVHFMSDESVARRGFRAEFQSLDSGCGGIFTADEAFIMSPNFPQNYNENDSCEYLIEVAKTNLVLLTFYDFDIPEATNCSFGHVAVYDGNTTSSPMLLRHCGSKPSQTISSTRNTMLVKLVADGVNIGKGFKAHYETGCGSRLLADEGGEIHSINYPYSSTKIANCSWILYTNQLGEKISLTVTHLHVTEESNCTYRSLIVQDGDMPDSPVIGQYCGYKTPPIIISRGSVLHVFLQNRGIFRATYGILSTHCGGDFVSPEGSFSSPGFPQNYPMEMECVWTVTGSLGSDVHLSFEQFNIEQSDYCNTDYVEVRAIDGGGPLLGKFCGDGSNAQMRSAHKLWIKFRSDDVGTGRGFLANYITETATTLNGTEGEITSPGYPFSYHQDKEYMWTIIAPDNMTISIQFLELRIASYGDECYASLIVYDGLGNTAPVLGQYCGFLIPDPISSTGNIITVVFNAKMYYTGSFHLRWNTALWSQFTITSGSSCFYEHILNASTSAIITSPAWPSYYSNNQDCTYIIKTSTGSHPEIVFDHFRLESGWIDSCPYDKLEAYFAPNPSISYWEYIAEYCGAIYNSLKIASPTSLLKLQFISDSVGQYEGFRARAESKCGDRLFTPSGTLKSSSIFASGQDGETSEAFNCSWQITVAERKTIKVTFVNFDVQSDCTTTYISLKNGGEPTSPSLGNEKHCGSSLPSIPETSSNKVLIQAVYDPQSGRLPVFELKWMTLSLGCGQHVFLTTDSPTAEISSPNYPSPPTPHVECEWVITAPPGRRIRFDFESQFQFSEICYGENNMEFLEVRDGGTQMAEFLWRYCHNDQPSSLMSTGNSLFLWYVTAVNQPNPGFKATVQIAECGGTISGYYRDIKSPNYPDHYGSSTECEWFLRMSDGYHMTIKINDFDTPPSSNCSNTDYLEIRDTDASGELLGMFCGNSLNLPLTVEIPGPEAYVRFKSNSAVTAKGFSMSMERNYMDGCGGNLEDPSGTITSPRYPNAVPYERHCYWSIKASPGRKIKIIFNEFNLPRDESTGECVSYLRIYNVTRTRDRSNVPKLCGTIVPQETDSNSYVNIILTSNGLSAGQGFSLSYHTNEESICGGTLTESSGTISTPNFPIQPGEFIECIWKIDIQQNKTLAIRFNALDIPGTLANYCREGVLVLIGDRNTFIGRYCGNYTTQKLVTSPFTTTYLRMITSLDTAFLGIRAVYNVSNCGGVIDGTNATITSPGYPNNYPPNIDCRWIITVPYGEELKLTFEKLDLEENCIQDYVRIRQGIHQESPIMGNFCGKTTPAPITTRSNTISIAFHSDEFGTAPGFKVTTRDIQRGCGGTIHIKSGSISSPNYPSRYNNSIECVWTVEFPSGYMVNLNFVGRFDIEMDSSCSKDYIQLEDFDSGGVMTTPVKKCGSAPPEPFTSISNKLRVTFHSNERINADGFKVDYKAVCGGNFTDNEGYIFSPNYPNFYDNNLKCTYFIGNRGQYIHIEFDEFSIEAHDSCVYDYIYLFQTSRYESEGNVGRFCGATPPAPRTLQAPVTMVFRTDMSYTSSGFSLRYEIENCGAEFTAPSGYISVSVKHLNYFTCKWHIKAQPNKVIALRFTHFNMTTQYKCWYDYVQVRDGNETDPLLGSYCGGLPPILTSSGDQLTVIYTSGRLATQKGFTAFYYDTYGVVHGCGGTRNATSGEITSLDVNNDGLYESNLFCTWTLLANAPDQVFKLTFEKMQLQDAVNNSCAFDYVEIREGSAVVGRYCGSVVPSPIMTSSTRIKVFFRSDDTINKSGFKITYTVTPSPCGTSSLIPTVEPQILRSPNYPNAYPVNLRCQWRFSTNSSNSDSTKTVYLAFEDLDLPCNGDYLEIRYSDQNTYGYRMLLRFCKDSNPEYYVANSQMVLQFHSDIQPSENRGFSLTYRINTCNTTYTSESGLIINPGFPSYYNDVGRCLINITVPEGRTISLTPMDIHFSSTRCVSSYIKFYDGLSTSDNTLAEYCVWYAVMPVFSTGNNMLIDIKLANQYGSYRFTYISTDKGRGCGGKLVATQGTFTSPFYPQPYNKTDECDWHVVVPSYHGVNVHFEMFELNSRAGCENNYVEVYEGPSTDPSSRIVRYCGTDVPRDLSIERNEFTLKMKTNETNNGSRFRLIFGANRDVSDLPEVVESWYD